MRVRIFETRMGTGMAEEPLEIQLNKWLKVNETKVNVIDIKMSVAPRGTNEYMYLTAVAMVLYELKKFAKYNGEGTCDD